MSWGIPGPPPVSQAPQNTFTYVSLNSLQSSLAEKNSRVETSDESILDHVLHEATKDDEREDAASLEAWWLEFKPLMKV